ncbi:MAG: hypothetical protein M1819_003048 [Sarea resinae]|nr:MAG: hypothetical protein M1819_003048 [Sarea resinae]
MTTPQPPTSISATTTTTTPPPLPPPQTFDILPPVHALLSRLLKASSSAPPPTYTDPQQAGLEAQHLPTEAAAIKIRIQKARAAIESLPDMDRTVVEQEAEIRELEEKAKRQREVLAGLREKGAAAAAVGKRRSEGVSDG